MILATHAVIGAAVANIFPSHPVLGFFASFASHFVADAIPHWHYHLKTTTKDRARRHSLHADMDINKDFPFDLLKISFDALLGIIVATFFFGVSQPYLLSATLIGAAGGVLPDALTFVYWKWRHEPLTSLQRFHLWIHAKTNYDDRPIFGPSVQVILALACVAVFSIFTH